MTVGAHPDTSHVNGTTDDSKLIELAIDLPQTPGMRVHLHLTLLARSILLFLASSSIESSPTAAPLGSFVYAMPDVSVR